MILNAAVLVLNLNTVVSAGGTDLSELDEVNVALTRSEIT